MKEIKQFKCEDGTIFDDEAKAERYEALCVKVAAAIQALGTRHAKVSAGDGYYQHHPDTVAKCWQKFVGLCRPTVNSYITETDASKISPLSFFGRILDDSDIRCLNDANHRFCCIDRQGREHQQPYFALNGPDKRHVQVN